MTISFGTPAYSVSSSTVGNRSVSYTTDSSNKFLMAFLVIQGKNVVPSIKYNNISMTSLLSTYRINQTLDYINIFYLQNPTATTANCVATFPSSSGASLFVFSISGGELYIENLTTNDGYSGSANVSITSTSSSAAVSMLVTQDKDATNGSGQTSILSNISSTVRTSFSYKYNTNNPKNLSWTFPSDDFAIAGFDIREAVSSSGNFMAFF